MFIMILWQ